VRTVTIGPLRPSSAGGAHGPSCLVALAEAYWLETVAHFQAPGAALAFAEAGAEAPEALIADISDLHDPAADGALVHLLEVVARCWPGCRVALVVGEAQHYLLEPLRHTDAGIFYPGQYNTLAAYLNLPRRRDVQARIVLAVSAKGGVGKTTLVANLATALAVRHGLRVGVVDGDLTRGDLARMLGLSPNASLLDLVADPDPGGIHAALDRYLVHASNGSAPPRGSLALLPAPGSSLMGGQSSTALTVRHAQAMLDALAGRFDVVLLDTPPDLQRSSPFPAAVLRSAEAVPADGGGLPFLALVVVQPQPMERLGARQVLDFLKVQPIARGRVRGVLVNRNRVAGYAAALERDLGVEMLATIPYDPRAATARLATDLVYDFGTSRLTRPARAYTRLAERIALEEVRR
jgi:Mrp family chromosome partitioning ATPase